MADFAPSSTVAAFTPFPLPTVESPPLTLDISSCALLRLAANILAAADALFVVVDIVGRSSLVLPPCGVESEMVGGGLFDP